MSHSLSPVERAIDNACVLGFVYGVALTSIVWIAFMLLGDAQ